MSLRALEKTSCANLLVVALLPFSSLLLRVLVPYLALFRDSEGNGDTRQLCNLAVYV